MLEVLRSLLGATTTSAKEMTAKVNQACVAAGITRDAKVDKAIRDAIAVPDPEGELQTDRKGQPLADTELRDNENVPLGESISDYLKREVLPHVPDAWLDDSKTKIGYEIPFTRHFYRYTPPRPLHEIDADIEAVESEIQGLLSGGQT